MFAETQGIVAVTVAAMSAVVVLIIIFGIFRDQTQYQDKDEH